MKHLVILGAGTAGTMTANQLRNKMPADWDLTVIDPERDHLYQPGLLFLPFGLYEEKQLTKPRQGTLRRGVRWIESAVEAVDPDAREVALSEGERVPYDLLVLATGSQIRPDENEGMLGDEWHKTVHDFYTLEGASVLRRALAGFHRGRLVLNVAEMPIKCPVAPLEFLFLADDYFRRKGVRDQIDLVYSTPLDGAFTKPVASEKLSYLLREKGIEVEAEFNLAAVDAENRRIAHTTSAASTTICWLRFRRTWGPRLLRSRGSATSWDLSRPTATRCKLRDTTICSRLETPRTCRPRKPDPSRTSKAAYWWRTSCATSEA